MNRLVRRFVQNDEGVVFTGSGDPIGSFDGSTRFRMGVSGGVFVAENTAPPVDTQLDLYSQDMLTISPNFFGASDAEIAQYIVDTYEWRLFGVDEMTASGATVGTWYDFNDSGLTVVTFTIADPYIDTPSYRLEIREKATGVEVLDHTFNLDI